MCLLNEGETNEIIGVFYLPQLVGDYNSIRNGTGEEGCESKNGREREIFGKRNVRDLEGARDCAPVTVVILGMQYRARRRQRHFAMRSGLLFGGAIPSPSSRVIGHINMSASPSSSSAFRLGS